MDTTRRVMRDVMKKVRDARRRAGLTQAHVADLLNCSQQAYNGYETLKRTMSIVDLVKLPAILGCRITDILPDSVVTNHDRARAKHHDLDRIIQAWPTLTEAQKVAMMASLAAFVPEETGGSF